LGVIVRCALAGAAFAVPDAGWSTARVIRDLGVTHASLVGTQLYRLLRDDPAPAPAHLRVALLGGGPASQALLDEAIGRGWPVANSYGLTEMGSTVTATRAGARDATAGAPLPGRIVCVVGDEIRVGGEGLFAGYLAGGGLDRPIDAEDLFRTGDLGSIDGEGRLTITGRADNRFVSGGENVQPEEVEAALASLSGVIRAIIVPVPNPEFGCRGVAFVETSDGTLPDEGSMAGALAERIPLFKIPVRFLPWPTGDAGFKPSRRELERVAAEVMGDE
jgi:O-succinylbenzoic acid--CoA ligase